MKNIIFTSGAPKPIGPYSQAIKTDNFLFVSGQLGLNEKGELPRTIHDQTAQALDNLKNILEAAGSSIDKVVKTTIFFTNIDDFSAINEIYNLYFKIIPPARSAICIAALPKNALIEIEAISLI